MRKIKAVIFDLGDTLLYFNGDWNLIYEQSDLALASTLEQSGMDLDTQAFRLDFRSRLKAAHTQRELDHLEVSTTAILKESLNKFGISNVAPEIIEAALASLYAVSQEQWIVEKDCESTLKTLWKQKYRLGLLSNAGDDVDLQTLVNKAQIRQFFDFVLSSEKIGYRKPHSAYFEAGLKNWDFNMDQIAMVGDKLHTDILGANNLGMFSIWINRRTEAKTPSGEITPDAIISSLSELPKLLKDL
jgi:FMN phosphatase YigB (HAD superfamily)